MEERYVQRNKEDSIFHESKNAKDKYSCGRLNRLRHREIKEAECTPRNKNRRKSRELKEGLDLRKEKGAKEIHWFAVKKPESKEQNKTKIGYGAFSFF